MNYQLEVATDRLNKISRNYWQARIARNDAINQYGNSPDYAKIHLVDKLYQKTKRLWSTLEKQQQLVNKLTEDKRRNHNGN
jgi:hypothetical protein